PPAAVGARLLSRAESLACRLGPTTARLHPGSAAPRPGAIPAPSRSPTAAQLTTRTTKLVRGGKGAVCPRVEVTSSTRAHPLRRAVRIETSRWCWLPGAKFRMRPAEAQHVSPVRERASVMVDVRYGACHSATH